jgi:hypothetical protein
VDHFGETLGWFAANALGRTVRSYVFRMLLFEVLKYLEHCIIFPVGYGGIVLNVIEVFVVADLFAQFLYSFFD